MSSKKAVENKDIDDSAIETKEEIGVFTPEEEAALDAAAKSGADEATETTKVEDDKPNPDDEIASLKKKLADSEAARTRAEEERKKAQESSAETVDNKEAEEATRIKIADEKAAADLELAERDVKDLNRQLREAKEAGDLDKEIEINDKLLDAKIKVKQTKDNIDRYSQWKDTRKSYWDNERKRTAKAATSNDDFDPSAYSPKSLEWIDRHPEFKTDKSMQERTVRAHYSALGERLEVDSPEYFRFIEKKIGLTKDDSHTSDEGAEAEAQADAAKPIVRTEAKKPAIQTQLPPSRSSGSTNVRQGSDRVKKLTPAEVEAAEISGMTPEEYWNDKYGNK